MSDTTSTRRRDNPHVVPDTDPTGELRLFLIADGSEYTSFVLDGLVSTLDRPERAMTLGEWYKTLEAHKWVVDFRVVSDYPRRREHYLRGWVSMAIEVRFETPIEFVLDGEEWETRTATLEVVPALRCDCGLLFPLGSELEENHGC